MEFAPDDLAFIADPYPVYAELRERTPIVLHEPTDHWLISRYEDVNALLRDRRFGRTYHHLASDEDMDRPSAPEWHAPFWHLVRSGILDMEPPDHTRVRRLVSKAFTPRMAEGLRPHDLLRPWSADICRMYELAHIEKDAHIAIRACVEFSDYLRALSRARRADPREDLISGLAQVVDEGERLTEDELIGTCVLLLNAGHEATVNVTGDGWWSLFRHPDQLQRLRADHSLVPRAIEELMRFDTPLQMFERWVLEDAQICGARVCRRAPSSACCSARRTTIPPSSSGLLRRFRGWS